MANLQVIVDAQVNGSDKVKGLGNDLKGLEGAAKSGGQGLKSLSVEQAAAAAKADVLRAKMKELGQAVASNSKTVDEATKEFNEFSKAVDIDGVPKATKGFGGLREAIGGLAATGALVEVGQQLVEFGDRSIDSAAAAEEAAAKFGTVFANVGGKVAGDLDAFADAANRSGVELRGMAANIGDILKPLGFTEEVAGNLSVDLVKLATDLSSFNDMPMDEALQRLQGTLIGSHENALAFGVVINENTLKAELAANGWDKLSGAALEQAKVQARLNLLFKGTTDAQGDAIRTANSYTNQQRALEAATLDLEIATGQLLIPVASLGVAFKTGLAEGLTEAIGGMDEATRKADELTPRFENIGKLVGGSLPSAFSMLGEVLPGLNSNLRLFEQILAKDEEEVVDLAAATEMSAAEVAAWEGRVARATQTTEAATAAVNSYSEQYRTNAAVANDAGQATDAYEVSADQVAEAEKKRADAHEEALKAQQDAAQAARDHAAAMGDFFSAAVKSEEAIGFFNESAAEMGQQFVTVGGRTAEQRAELSRLGGELDDLQGTYDKAADTLRDYELGLKGVGLSGEELNKKMDEQRAIMGNAQAAMVNYTAAMEPLNAITGEVVEKQGTMTINQEAVNQAIFDAADAQNASAEELAILAGALGLYSDEAVEAALQTALIQAKINELTAAYLDGKIGVDEMRGSLNDFIAGLGETDAQTSQTTGVVRDLRTELLELEGLDVEARVDVDTTAAESALERIRQLIAAIGSGGVNVDTTVGGGGRQHGGPVSARVPYMVGEAGPEMFVPSTNGTIIPNSQINSGNVSLSVAVYPQSNQPAAIARATADKVQQALRESGIVGLRG